MQEGEKGESKQLVKGQQKKTRKGKISKGENVEKERPDCRRTTCWA